MNRIDRLFGILTLLQSRKFVPAEKIAEKFGISVRTVYRDVKALCELGIPVSFGQNRGSLVVQGFFLPPVSFSATEANALLLTEALAYGFADKSIQEHYTSALNKIKAVMRNSDKEKLESLGNIKLQLPARLSQIQATFHKFSYPSPKKPFGSPVHLPLVENQRARLSQWKWFYAHNTSAAVNLRDIGILKVSQHKAFVLGSLHGLFPCDC
jgi:predicted DNA-binding transcriptional regulator YafY